MATVYLRLKNEDGSYKEYRKENVKARWVREGFAHSKKIDELDRKGDAMGLIDERLKFTCGFFGDKELTPDVILDGLENDELIPVLDEVFHAIIGKVKQEGKNQGNE